MLGVLYEWCIWFRVHVSTFAKRDLKDRGFREPTGPLERPERKDGVVTCLIQIVHEPDEVILLKVLHPLFVLLAVKCIVEPICESG